MCKLVIYRASLSAAYSKQTKFWRKCRYEVIPILKSQAKYCTSYSKVGFHTSLFSGGDGNRFYVTFMLHVV